MGRLLRLSDKYSTPITVDQHQKPVENVPMADFRPFYEGVVKEIPQKGNSLTGVLREGLIQGRRTALAYDHITLKTRHPVRSGKLSNVESRRFGSRQPHVAGFFFLAPPIRQTILGPSDNNTTGRLPGKRLADFGSLTGKLDSTYILLLYSIG
ncbi:unnamed protein product [Caenorhabditis auriculariae]|uniref:Uncharacterized protein n=1 Tax=Caenorhabditis auriculariae TaxID=2777116 RepID=A0A8S1HKB7_9PELO|nr:unnamed protein product [Caenorhabditis auriculariae]